MKTQGIDLVLFIGQSNMAGRGIVSAQWPQEAPKLIEGAAWEYRAITTPDRLMPLEEPFGVDENKADGINDVFFVTTIAHCHDLQSFLFFCFVILVELYNMILLILIVLTGTGIQNWKLSILNPELLQSGSEKNNLI